MIYRRAWPRTVLCVSSLCLSPNFLLLLSFLSFFSSCWSFSNSNLIFYFHTMLSHIRWLQTWKYVLLSLLPIISTAEHSFSAVSVRLLGSSNDPDTAALLSVSLSINFRARAPPPGARHPIRDWGSLCHLPPGSLISIEAVPGGYTE